MDLRRGAERMTEGADLTNLRLRSQGEVLAVRVTRLRLVRFRGFEDHTLIPSGNVLLAGEPRGGRSTILDALRRVLDSTSTRVRPSRWDVSLPLLDVNADETYPLTYVEVTLVGVEDAIEQVLDDRLELVDPVTGEPTTGVGDAVLGVRLRYCLQYNPTDDTVDHWVEYPKAGLRVPKLHRELLHAIIIDRSAPLQLRAEGAFRSLAASQDPTRLTGTIDAFGESVRQATSALSKSEAIVDALTAMTVHGASLALNVDRDQLLSGVGFAAEDGSINGLLRAIQPTLDVDSAGPLPLGSHGSTASSILSITDALAAGQFDNRIVVVDDFGDSLDSASADFLARLLRRPDNQVWLSTRRAEATAAFDAEEIVRVTRGPNGQTTSQLGGTPDRTERRRRRYLSQILAPALSARAVVFVEGPHDSEAYAALDAKRLAEDWKAPLSARGVQMLPASATGADGGKSRLVDLATIAKSLGFAVGIVLDNDKPGDDDELIAELVAICDAVVVLPKRTAVERALVHGLPPQVVRKILRKLSDEFELNVKADEVVDSQLEQVLIRQLKQKGGLHRAMIALLPESTYPPIALEVLKALKRPMPAGSLIEISEP